MILAQIATQSARPSAAESYAAATLRERLAEVASKIKRITIHVDEGLDHNGHPMTVCRVKVVLSPLLDVEPFVMEGHASRAREAIDLVADAIEGAVRRPVEEAAKARLRRRGKRVRLSGVKVSSKTPSEVVLRRARVDESLETPRSANPPRGKHFHMTRHQSRATSSREVEAGARPSRKSTRKSANRSKRDSNLARRATRGTRAPAARARGRSG
jgi:hypothetical protein